METMKYYNHYTGRPWGARENYDLYIDSEKAGIEGAVEQIAARYQILSLGTDHEQSLNTVL